MCLEEPFCTFSRDALNFRTPKKYMSRRTVQQCAQLPLSLIVNNLNINKCMFYAFIW